MRSTIKKKGEKMKKKQIETSTTDEWKREARMAFKILALCKRYEVTITPRLLELLELMRIPEFAQSMHASVVERKEIYKHVIKSHYEEIEKEKSKA
jgi:hypothetical protein